MAHEVAVSYRRTEFWARVTLFISMRRDVFVFDVDAPTATLCLTSHVLATSASSFSIGSLLREEPPGAT